MFKKISGWGNNTKFYSNIFYPKNISELKKMMQTTCIARGMGRSYGDSAIQPNCTISTLQMNKVISFDKQNGIIEVESGISIRSLLKQIVKLGWFLPVTPGSKDISIGGMIASDVHGKNHHRVGNFKNFILELKLIDHNKKILECSRKKKKKLFNYTVGGMGLTGIIYSCRFKLKKISSNFLTRETIKNNSLKQTLDCINKSSKWEYNVAWIDTSASQNLIGRSIITRANFIKRDKTTEFYEKKKINFGILLNLIPSLFMNRYLIKLLNELYFYFNKSNIDNVDIDTFFYPLDSIKKWNKIYGSKGFISYQCSIPKKNSYNEIKKILEIIKKEKIYSFVSVLKSMGKSDKDISFSQKGYTLVFDFPIYSNVYKVLDNLDESVKKNKGKIYLCKDSRISRKRFIEINNEFMKKDFTALRKIQNYFFESIQSKRLGI